MIRADLFSGSLAVWNLRSGIFFARPPIPSRAVRGEDRIPFELIQEYTASWENANASCPPRFARRLICMGFFPTGGGDVPKLEPLKRLNCRIIDKIVRDLRRIYKEKPNLFDIPTFLPGRFTNLLNVFVRKSFEPAG